MMVLYLDSSALVKRYIHEAHSEAVAHLLDETVAIATAAISRVEVVAALARAARGNRLDAHEARRAQEQFAEDWPDFGKVPVTDSLLTRAETLAWKHGLRAYDAVQLAAALVCEDAHGPRRERPVRMLRRGADSRGERGRAQDLAELTELPARPRDPRLVWAAG